MDLAAILKGIALIEQATNNPRAKALIAKVLPELGLTEAQVAQLDGNHADYQRLLADAQRRAGQTP